MVGEKTRQMQKTVKKESNPGELCSAFLGNSTEREAKGQLPRPANIGNLLTQNCCGLQVTVAPKMYTTLTIAATNCNEFVTSNKA